MASLRFPMAGLALVSAFFGALPVAAQTHMDDRAVATSPGQYDGTWSGGWVGPEGQVYRGNWQGTYHGRDGQNYPGSYSGQWTPETSSHVQAAPYRGEISSQREAWMMECRRRLDVANRARDGIDSYRAVCDAWLGYYERNGMTQKGYGFNYAIPVTLVALAPRPIACCVTMKPAPRPHYKMMKTWHSKGHWHSKRVRIVR